MIRSIPDIVKGKNILCKAFYYKNADFNTETGRLRFTYAVDNTETLTEEVVFPGAPFTLTPDEKQALDTIWSLARIAVGISYYKAFLPADIVIEGTGLTATEASFFERFYLQGLGEFAIRNNLDLQGRIHFPTDPSARRQSFARSVPLSALVPVGGGKDSCVTLELAKELTIPATPIAVGEPRPIRACMDISGLPDIILKRTISPRLIELNATGGVYNGHVPITGILAFLLWAAAILYKKRYVMMSCERSANVGNMMQGNLPINHQYSKSIDFEQDFWAITRTITPDFRYFSLLRPLSEAHIAKLFSEKCTAYFPVFTSCNKAFKLDKTKRLNHWCSACDKCRFVFLILAPFMDRENLIQIVGHNPLNDTTQTEGYRELLGLSGHKPFECVGEVDECRWAFSRLMTRPDWQHDAVIQQLKNEVPSPDADLIFTPSDIHLIPQEVQHVLAFFQ